MKKIFSLLFLVMFAWVGGTADAAVSVKGYYKSNGTYVAPYVRSNPNGLKSDNYSYTSSQGIYNKTYGTKGVYWDTPTSVTDPDYYLGKSIYDSGKSSAYSSTYSAPVIPSCPLNAYYNSVSSACSCNYGYVSSGGSCISKNTWCTNNVGVMSSYNSASGTCECLSGYEYNGSSCVYKIKTYPSSSTAPTTSVCPLNSHASLVDSTKCQCDSGYQVNSTKTACVLNAATLYVAPQQDDKLIGKDYYLTNKTCVGLSGNQFSECITYAYNH